MSAPAGPSGSGFGPATSTGDNTNRGNDQRDAPPIDKAQAQELGFEETQVPRQIPPEGSIRKGDKQVSMHKEKYTIFERFARGPEGEDREVPTGSDEQKLLEPYALVIKRLAREKWIGFKASELAKFWDREINIEIQKHLFGGVPDEMLTLTFVDANNPWSGSKFTVNKAESDTEGTQQDWLRLLRPDDKQEYRWIALRHYDAASEFLVVRDGWFLEYPMRWNIQRYVERDGAQVANDVTSGKDTQFDTAQKETSGVLDTIKRFEDCVRELFPVSYEEKRTFWVQVDRYKREWLRYPPIFKDPSTPEGLKTATLEAVQANDADARTSRNHWFYNFLWRIDDAIINIYPEGRHLEETYEHYERRKIAELKDPRRGHRRIDNGAMVGFESDAHRPPVSRKKAKDLFVPPGPQKGMRNPDTPVESIETGTSPQQLSPGTVIKMANKLICRQHKGCRTRLDVMSEQEQADHASMHRGEQCKADVDCHAWIALMNTSEHAAHATMHVNWGGDASEANMQDFPEYIVSATAGDVDVCQRHQDCHARVRTMDTQDYRWHEHMHTARRCKMNVNCYTPLDVLNGVEIEEHVKMHMRNGEESSQELRQLLESPGIFEDFDKVRDLLDRERGHALDKNWEEARKAHKKGVKRKSSAASSKAKKQKTAKDGGREEEEEEGGEVRDSEEESVSWSESDGGDGDDGEGSEDARTPSQQPITPAEQAAGVDNDPANWPPGWEFGVLTQDDTNRFEHCPFCDASIRRMGRNKTAHKAKHGANIPSRYKTYDAGKKKPEN